ncbi:DUF6011 domain-containing protein [Amycolatopsis jejuensis]|uniref:DUF6011 domain-containing protein n=1 Tax=Amycolatopsis jejuensis TaxID=330084 RepID=UPI0005254C55|nr:DUF6011 domain-containing protein [Amycolatopsis jejuensis]
MTASVCEKCHRPLKDVESKRRKYGPVCYRKLFGPPEPKLRSSKARPSAARPVDHHPVDPNQIPLMEVEVPVNATPEVQHRLTVEHSGINPNTYRGECSCDDAWAWVSLVGLGGLEGPWRDHIASLPSAKDDGHAAPTVQEGQKQ